MNRRLTSQFEVIFVCVAVAGTGLAVWFEEPGVMRSYCWVLWGLFAAAAVAWVALVWWPQSLDGGPGGLARARRRKPVTHHTRIASRSKARHEDLTDDERSYLGFTFSSEGRPRCPDCGHALFDGPEGGLSMNMACRACGSEFNLSFFSHRVREAVVVGERGSDAGPRDLGDRHHAYRTGELLPEPPPAA